MKPEQLAVFWEAVTSVGLLVSVVALYLRQVYKHKLDVLEKSVENIEDNAREDVASGDLMISYGTRANVPDVKEEVPSAVEPAPLPPSTADLVASQAKPEAAPPKKEADSESYEVVGFDQLGPVYVAISDAVKGGRVIVVTISDVTPVDQGGGVDDGNPPN